jgi:hypothetical protein
MTKSRSVFAAKSSLGIGHWSLGFDWDLGPWSLGFRSISDKSHAKNLSLAYNTKVFSRFAPIRLLGK